MQELVSLLHSLGAILIGFADLPSVPAAQARGCPRAVSFAMALDPAIVAGIVDGPTDAYMAEYNRLNALLTDAARAAADLLTQAGYRAHPCLSTGDIDWDTITAPFPHKTAARLAGLGWIGKCALLVNPDFGSAVRWNTILTDAPLPTGTPMDSRCGACKVCQDICPGHAVSGREWQPGMSREGFWDPHACLAGMKLISTGSQASAHICGLCVAHCPHTQAHLRRSAALR